MASSIKHRKSTILTLEPGEKVPASCRPGDIVLAPVDGAWWTLFIGANGEIDSYDQPFESYNKALWTAKAAAEFDAE